MAVRPVDRQADTMTQTVLRGRAATQLTLRSLAVAGALALALAGCSAVVPLSTDDMIPDEVDAADTGGDASGENDDEVTVVGADLTSFSAALLAETYAEGRDPMPTAEFLDANTVLFGFGGDLTEEQVIGNCQIAWGVMSGESIRVLFTLGTEDFDCTAYMEG